jgi:hypothetical protein
MYSFNIMVTAKEYTSGTESAWWHVRGGITRDTGVATTAIIGTNTVDTGNAGGSSVNWTFTATADTTNGSLKLEVQNVGAGPGTNVKWVAVVEVAKVSV